MNKSIKDKAGIGHTHTYTETGLLQISRECIAKKCKVKKKFAARIARST